MTQYEDSMNPFASIFLFVLVNRNLKLILLILTHS